MRRSWLALAGLVTATLAVSCLAADVRYDWPLHRGFRRSPPQDFFTGAQLDFAEAIQQGDLDRVKGLARNVDLNGPGHSDMTLLAFAFQEAVAVKSDGNDVRFRIISQLVKDGANPQQTFFENSNVAVAAARADTPNFLKALLAGGMNPDLRYYGDSPLLFATAKDRQLPEMKVLVEHKADVNIRDSIGDTALINATQLRQWDTVDYLHAHGADPTIANSNGVTYSKVLAIELRTTPKGSPQLERIDAIAKRIVAAGGKWPAE